MVQVYTDASHFNNRYSYAFWIVWKNINYRESWLVWSVLENSTHAEYKAVEKAILYLKRNKIKWDITFYRDNVFVNATNGHKNSKILKAILNRYGRNNYYFQYIQWRKTGNKYHKWCDKNSRKAWSVKTKINSIRDLINDWINCIIPKNKDYRETILNFNNRRLNEQKTT